MRSLALSLVVFTLAGCPTVTPSPHGVTPIRTQGVYRHEPSGFVFPPSIASFRRVEINQYDQAGLDVGVGYNLVEPDAEIALTLYITLPAKQRNGRQTTLSEQFQAEIGAIQFHHSGAPVLAQESVSIRQAGVLVSGLRARFEYEQEVFGDRSRQVESLLYLFELSGWRIKYRVTFSSSQRPSALRRWQQFLSALRVPTLSSPPVFGRAPLVFVPSSPPVVGRAHLGDEPAAGIVVQLSFSQINKDCVPSDPSTITDQSGSFRFARGVGEPLPVRDRASGRADDPAALARAMIGGVWRLCFEGRTTERRSFSWPWIGDPALTYATMECDLASQEEKPCAGSWLAE